MPTLLYIADPMCSWCYGFGPELHRLLEGLPDIQVDLVMGGLRANNTSLMDDGLKANLLGHWEHVAKASGLPFSEAGLSHPGFIYNTEPACRAVVAARMLAPAAALPVFHAIQHAFYAEAQDVTQGAVLARLAADALTRAGHAIEARTFHYKWAEEEVIAATQADFEQTVRWNVTGFPTLVLERPQRLDLITSGYATTEELVERMQAILDQDS